MPKCKGDRWIVLQQTSPSGKQQFKCNSCGRISVTPDKICATESEQKEALQQMSRRWNKKKGGKNVQTDGR